MSPSFRLIPSNSIEAAHSKHLAAQREEILSGKISVRWSQACCGYRIRVGRNALLGVDSFTTKEEALEWLKQTHNLELK
jgi:hypothetical protein